MNKSILLLVILSALSGCFKVGPNFTPPSVPKMDKWREEIAVSSTLRKEWWKVFDDPILNELIEKAYQQNLTLKAACYRILEARAKLGIAIGEFFPQTQAGFGSMTKTKLSEGEADVAVLPLQEFHTNKLGVQVAWEIDIWGKYRRAIEAQEALVAASIADYDDVLVLLIADLASTYVELRTIEEQIEIVKTNVKIQERSLEISQAQFEGGFVSELDVQQATAFLKDTESRLPNLERRRQQAENALCLLLGEIPQKLHLEAGYARIPKGEDFFAVTMPESILYQRPDVRKALYDTAAQSERIGIAYADYFPQLSLTGILAAQSDGKLLSRDNLTYTYGTNFFIPLFTYGRITNHVRLEKARFCEQMMLYRNLVLRAYEEVENGLVAYFKHREQVDFLNKSVRAAERSVELSKKQYVEGMTDYTTVLNTQEAQLREQERETIARGNIAQSLIATYKALGGGWEIKCCGE